MEENKNRTQIPNFFNNWLISTINLKNTEGSCFYEPLILNLGSSLSSIFVLVFSVIFGYVLYENVLFAWKRQKKGKGGMLPGPSFVAPFIGTIYTMVMNPYQYWEDQKNYSFPGMSWTSILGTFTVFVTDAKIIRNLLNYNSEDTLLMAVHPSGRNILGEGNLAFMHGPDHKAIRKSFLALFTRKALARYVQIQDRMIWKHLRQWMQDYEPGKPREMRTLIREMNAETSQEVFAGPYLTDPVEREKFSQSFRAMTEGFLAFPICLPGTKVGTIVEQDVVTQFKGQVWKGKQGRLHIVSVLTRAAEKSKQLMDQGEEPKCLMDYWAIQVLQEEKEAKLQGVSPPKHCDTHKMADTVIIG
eukprot:TRINITY_DN17878_c0_g1_i1.p1 TRINITY_DN17878_c0_g1~~TRINITY_DN17878_c0_g1_i1.p1  ORF type:complete len:358 (+),score=38.48 TRINITY_DN17878_c0_g1_i1:220-1293(+)